MENKALEQAAREAGISSGFINAHGKQQAIAAETKRELLSAMGWVAERHPAVTPVPLVKVFVTGSRLALPVGETVNTAGRCAWKAEPLLTGA